ncbi:acetyl-CoA C-acetyltransferase [Metallosphaera sp.]|uniref:acetyl-CoA C-acetyltransferase n=1 Tax=Metallosphaera sp. TaxID=2020860 RepID=UPI0031722050
MDAYIVDFVRTAFSRSRPREPERDVFNNIRMDEAVALLIKKLVARTGINPREIDDVIIGCAFQVGENWLYGGRMPVLLAGLPVEVPAMSIDRQCSSSMAAVAMGVFEIMSGNSRTVLAGGMEHMTHVPMSNNPMVSYNEKLLTDPAYREYHMDIGFNMGLTAEKLARKEGITREEMDQLAFRSHKLAADALDKGWFRDEILPLKVRQDGNELIVDTDQSIRKDTTMETLRSLKPAFTQDGLVTAGNSSPLNAGASMLMVMDENTMDQYGIRPLARIVSFGWAGVDPSVMGEGPVPATRKALKKAGLSVDDIDYWEINEAFAVVVLNAIKKLGIDPEKVNIHGGAIAIGHPLGATGARLVGTLSRILNEKKGQYGVATLCVGGGQGYTTVLERV